MFPQRPAQNSMSPRPALGIRSDRRGRSRARVTSCASAARAVSAAGGWILGVEPRGPLFDSAGAALRVRSGECPAVANQAQELARVRLNPVDCARANACRKTPDLAGLASL